MDDRYPATDEHQSVHLDYPYPDAQRDLNRWLPLVKWLLAIPHYIVLFFLGVAALVVVIVAWFAILFTGRHPRGMFDFVEDPLAQPRLRLRVGPDHRPLSTVPPGPELDAASTGNHAGRPPPPGVGLYWCPGPEQIAWSGVGER